MNFGTVRKIVFVLMTAVSLPSLGQDLIANQAPIDRRMRAVDSVALQKMIRTEQVSGDVSALYPTWNNRSVGHYNVAMPREFRVDLRGFYMPTPSRIINSRFGPRWGRMHCGLDIKVYLGDTIKAAFSGKVRIVRYDARGYGNYVVIRHPNGLETVYGHLSKQLVSENENVRAGEPIGLGGSTGHSTGTHLHFETRLLGKPINPAFMFDFVNQDVTGDYYVYRSNASDDRNLAMANAESGDNNSSSASQSDVVVQFHKVARGETLYSIAQKRHTTVEELCKLNSLEKNTKLHAGQILRYS
jgi:LysM repeat protein